MKVAAILLAAGEGRRMGAKVNKVFLPLKSKPIISYSLALFEKIESVQEIICVVQPKDQGLLAASFKGMSKVSAIVSGGDTRSASVRAGLVAVSPEIELIIIHDAARPLADAENVEQLIARAATTGAATLAVPVKDTIKQVQNQQVVTTPPREQLWVTQTPQGFWKHLIEKAHSVVAPNSSDDAALVEPFHRVSVVLGSYRNIKITTPIDMVVAEAVLAAREGEERLKNSHRG